MAELGVDSCTLTSRNHHLTLRAVLTGSVGRGPPRGAWHACRGVVHLTVAAHRALLTHCAVDRQEVALGTAH